MNICVLNESHACSTLMLYNLSQSRSEFVYDFKRISKSNQEVGGHYINEYAFITASTIGEQRTARQVLKELGFVRHGPIRNEKNGTNVSFWILPVKEFLKNYKTWSEKYK